jgi:hypothetical protein
VLAFAADASGDATPLRVISGAFASLVMATGEYPNGLGFDENSGRLLISIANTNPNAHGRIVIHAKDGNGFALSVLNGDSTGIDSAPGTAAVTFDRIFRNGFDGY